MGQGLFAKTPLGKYFGRIKDETARQRVAAVSQRDEAMPLASSLAVYFEKNHIAELTRKSLFGS